METFLGHVFLGLLLGWIVAKQRSELFGVGKHLPVLSEKVREE